MFIKNIRPCSCFVFKLHQLEILFMALHAEYFLTFIYQEKKICHLLPQFISIYHKQGNNPSLHCDSLMSIWNFGTTVISLAKGFWKLLIPFLIKTSKSEKWVLNIILRHPKRLLWNQRKTGPHNWLWYKLKCKNQLKVCFLIAISHSLRTFVK